MRAVKGASLLVAMMAVVSCHDSPTQPNRTWYFRADLDGLPYAAEYIDYSWSTGSHRMRINGVREIIAGAQRQVTLDLAWKGTGTYTLAGPAASSSFGFVLDLDAQQRNTGMWFTSTVSAGTVEVTEYDAKNHWVAGRFSFQADPESAVGAQVRIAAGQFGGYYYVDP
ncbi:MAG: DUF6252 family protein [Gemmatimonadaceae bacterium]